MAKKQTKLQEGMKKFGNKWERFIMSDNPNYYDTVGNTVCSPKLCFQFMQLVRFLMTIALFGLLTVYFFIFVKVSFVTINFWAIFFTFLAIMMLFVGSGKQRVYQLIVDNEDGNGNALYDKPKYMFDDQKKKVKLWWYGLFFYNLAIPVVFASNALFYIGYKQKVPEVKQQIINYVDVNYIKTSQGAESLHNWRIGVLKWSQQIPLICLCFELVTNRLKLRPRLFVFYLIFLILYFVISYFFETSNTQMNRNFVVYPKNIDFTRQWPTTKLTFGYLLATGSISYLAFFIVHYIKTYGIENWKPKELKD